MIDRLLDRFEPQRRHLAFLVGLLVLTFALTVMLAVKAHRAEVARQQQAQAVLQDMSGKAVQEWARHVEQVAIGTISGSFGNSGRLFSRDRNLPLSEFLRVVNPSALCEDCPTAARRAFFSADPISQVVSTAGPDPFPKGLLDEIRFDVQPDRYQAIHDSIAAGLYLVELNGRPEAVAALIRFGPAGEIVRIVGYHVPSGVISDVLALVFDALPVLPTSLSRGVPNDSFFSVHASIGGLMILSTPTHGSFVVTDTVRRAPFDGLVLRVGIRENAATKLLIDGAVTSGVPLLLTLLFTICGLIMLALLLVRREAELVRLRADFISGVSHELRTPLAQIRMFTETLLLNRVRSDVERRRSLEIIDQEARRLTHLVENVLLFSKSEGGRRTPIAPEPTDLAAEVRRAAESFGPLCRPRNVGLRTELQDGITVAVDRGALRQIMVNLLDNALKYGPSGQRVTVGVALFDDHGRVWVDDEGPGIPAEDRERVFDSFYRLPRDVESRSSGSGIGLAVVRELARLHGGDAWAEDAPGGGTRIVAQFPDAYLRTEPAADLAAAS
jgi:signal transduction histidine kinase